MKNKNTLRKNTMIKLRPISTLKMCYLLLIKSKDCKGNENSYKWTSINKTWTRLRTKSTTWVNMSSITLNWPLQKVFISFIVANLKAGHNILLNPVPFNIQNPYILREMQRKNMQYSNPSYQTISDQNQYSPSRKNNIFGWYKGF